MSALAAHNDFNFILESFDWDSHAKATMVDVGGGSGAISQGLAHRLNEMKFIVQDSDEVVRHSIIDSSLKDRISFMVHDFFQEQPVKGAEIYYFRNIFHNWPDTDCISILRAVTPALAPGAHIIIDDFGLQDPLTLPAFLERQQRYVDIYVCEASCLKFTSAVLLFNVFLSSFFFLAREGNRDSLTADPKGF